MGWMRNKAVAIVLAIVAIAAVGYAFKDQISPPKVTVNVRFEDKTVAAVCIPADAKFPLVIGKKKAVAIVNKYRSPKTKKVIYLTEKEYQGYKGILEPVDDVVVSKKKAKTPVVNKPKTK